MYKRQLMYGIPNMKLDKSVIARREDIMRKEGVEFKTGIDVGKDVNAKEILKEFDAVDVYKRQAPGSALQFPRGRCRGCTLSS